MCVLSLSLSLMSEVPTLRLQQVREGFFFHNLCRPQTEALVQITAELRLGLKPRER